MVAAQKELLEAIEKNDTEGVKRAVKNGADIHRKELNEGEFYHAVLKYHPEYFKLADELGMLPLDAAAYFNAKESFELLVELGANAKDSRAYYYRVKGWTWQNQATCPDYIVKSAADINLLDGEAMRYAAIIGYTNSIAELIQHGADVTLAHADNMTPLMVLIYQQDDLDVLEDGIKIFIEAGADLFHKDVNGLTALDHYRKKNVVYSSERGLTAEDVGRLLQIPMEQMELDSLVQQNNNDHLNTI